MSSMQYCYESAQKETCKEKCLESCYGHKPNNSGSYYAGQSTALCGQTTPYACTDHNMTKPAMNHSSYDQTLYGQPTMMPNPNMSHNSYCQQTYGHGDHMTSATPVGMGRNHCVDKVHGHGHAGQQQYANSHGMGSGCHGNKSHEKKTKEKKGDYCKKKKAKSLCKNKYRDGNRSCSDSSGPDSD